jgi:uncharacterized protein (TIGR03000 family)
MRKILLVLSLAGLTVLAASSDASATGRGGRSGGGGRGGSVSRGSSVNRGYAGGGYGRGGYGYGGGGYGYGAGYFGGVYLGGLGYSNGYYGPFAQGYGYDYAPGYDGTPALQTPAMPLRQSYFPRTSSQSASVTVLVPTADAKVWFDNTATTQNGMERSFVSPALEPNQNFTYTIKARWMENGQPVNQERQVHVQAGQNITANFREKSRETLPTPLTVIPQN